MPNGSNNSKAIQLLKIGHCRHPEFIVQKGGRFKFCEYPAIVTLIKHPGKGYVLFDTGYSPRFVDATQGFPNRLYRWLTPMTLNTEECLLTQLAQQGIGADDINTIFISHFHADHIAGLKDFPNAQYICSKQAYHSFISRHGFSALLKGYLKALLPADFLRRVNFIEASKVIKLDAELPPFTDGYDLFGDGALIAVALPGHAFGHFGLLCNIGNHPCFLVADASWSLKAIRDNIRPNPLAMLIMSQRDQYYETLSKLSRLHHARTDLTLIPSHCLQTFQQFSNE